jgi:single-stranded-DNA-specific exonuclease
MPILGADKVLVEKYASDFSIPRELAEIVARRYPEYSEAKKYLFPSLADLYEPSSIPDINSGVREIIHAVKMNEGILIYTHDDVDGYTSASIVYKALDDITRGSDTLHVYPVIREQDGYILNPQVLRFYREKGVRLLLTVDFGISNAENFRIAEQVGLKAVICDHHETTLEKFPVPAVNPKRPDSNYPFRELAGVGVAFKLAQLLYHEFFGISEREFYSLKKNFFPILCVGTISDRVVLRDENRVFCRHGLQLINDIDETWVAILKESGGIDINRILREVIPTLGSAAYVDPKMGVEFLIEHDADRVIEIYKTLRETDQKRRQEIDSVFNDVVSNASVSSRLALSVIPLQKQHYLGSVAARLRDYYRRNSIIVGVGSDKCVGELRSCDLDLYKMLCTMQALFFDFGGHKKAAGFSMDKANLELFLGDLVKYVQEHASDIPDSCNTSMSEPETMLRRTDVGMLEALVPFGEGNPAPVLTDGVSSYTVDNMLNVIDRT